MGSIFSRISFLLLLLISTFCSFIFALPSASPQAVDDKAAPPDDNLNDLATKAEPGKPANSTLRLLRIKDNLWGERDITYFVTSDSLAVVDGDIIYGHVNELLSRRIPRVPRLVDIELPAIGEGIGNKSSTDANTNTDSKLKTRAHTLFANSGRIWPDATVPYKYDSDATETLLKATVDAALGRWTEKAPYVKFVKRPNGAGGINGVVTIQGNACDGCIASWGYDNSPRRMNLQTSCGSATGVAGMCGVDEATHEFGHLLGFHHEHQREDRNTYVRYNCANLLPQCSNMPPGSNCCSANIPSNCCPAAGAFSIITGTDSSGPYDTASLFHYRSTAFALPGTDTLTPLNGVTIPIFNPGSPSDRDFDRLCDLHSARCRKWKECRSVACPARCLPGFSCIGLPACSGPNPPACCSGDPCRTRRSECTRRGCDFLKPPCPSLFC